MQSRMPVCETYISMSRSRQRPSAMDVRGDVRCWRCEMMGDVGVRQRKIDDEREEMKIEQRFHVLMLSKSMKDGRE